MRVKKENPSSPMATVKSWIAGIPCSEKLIIFGIFAAIAISVSAMLYFIYQQHWFKITHCKRNPPLPPADPTIPFENVPKCGSDETLTWLRAWSITAAAIFVMCIIGTVVIYALMIKQTNPSGGVALS